MLLMMMRGATPNTSTHKKTKAAHACPPGVLSFYGSALPASTYGLPAAYTPAASSAIAIAQTKGEQLPGRLVDTAFHWIWQNEFNTQPGTKTKKTQTPESHSGHGSTGGVTTTLLTLTPPALAAAHVVARQSTAHASTAAHALKWKPISKSTPISSEPT